MATVKPIVRIPSGSIDVKEEYFTGTNLASQYVTLSHIPFLPLIRVEKWDYTNTKWISMIKDSTDENLKYTVSGTLDSLNTIITFGTTAITGVSEDDIHIVYQVGKLTVNSELKISATDIVFNVEKDFIDGSGTARQALVDSAWHQQIDVVNTPFVGISNVAGELVTADDWTGDFRAMTVSLGSIDTKLTDISGSVGGISTSLDNIEAYAINISGSVGGISTSLGNIDADLDITNSKLENISGSVGGISLSLANIKTATELIDDTVYTDGAGTPSKGILVFGSDGTFARALAVNNQGELKVNLETADIEIGAVELKDGDSDTRVDIESDGTKNALFVQANNLDIRDLSSASDSVEVIGEVSVNNVGITLATGTANIGTVNGSEVSVNNTGITLATGNAHIGSVSANINNAGLTIVSGDIVVSGEVSVNNAGITLATGSANIGTVNGSEISINNAGITLATGSAEVGKFQITDGSNEVDVDATTKALLVKEVTGASEIANINITSISGEVQTAGNWTQKFNNINTDTNGISTSVGSINTKITVCNTSSVIANINNAGVTLAVGTNNIGTVNGSEVSVNNTGITIATGTAEIGKVQISDGTDVALIDGTTKALLVKEVSGATEIANMNITSVSGTVQTAGDWTVNFNTIQNDTELCKTYLYNISGSVGGITHSLGNIDTDLDTTNIKLQNISGSVGGITHTLGTINTQLLKLNNISNSVSGISISLGNIDSNITACNTGAVVVSTNVYPANATSFTTGQVSISSYGGTQFPSVVIPAGFAVVIKAKAGNAGTISLGDTQAKSVSSSTGCFKIEADQGVKLGISNLNLVYGDTTVLNEGVEYITEAS